MAFIAADDIMKAKEMDLMTYLRNYEPQELVHVSGNTYCTREHDSLRISNGKWYWFSQDIGGRSALDYLIKVKGLSFMEAVEAIIGQAAERPPVFYRQKEKAHHDFLMPKLSDTTYQVERYLRNRGIHPVIIRYCIEHKTLFESADYHNAVFVGYDKDGTARYGALRGTVGQYKGELTGSDKHFSFSIGENTGAKEIHVFESAIDAMSYATSRHQEEKQRFNRNIYCRSGVADFVLCSTNREGCYKTAPSRRYCSGKEKWCSVWAKAIGITG